MNFEIAYQQYGEKAILLSWPNRIEKDILNDIVKVKRIIMTHKGIQLLDVTNGYNSLLLLYIKNEDIRSEINSLKALITSCKKENNTKEKPSKWIIPVCYHDSFGMDLQALAKAKKIKKQEIINLHTTPDYHVYCKGFLPGFMYLGGLDSKLHMSRKSTPRIRIPKNSVAIGGKQTGIYPSESPGGWQIIGRTPVTLFDINSKTVSPIKLGDVIRFKEILLAEYNDLNSNKRQLTSEFE